jgi:hypothetical protein
MAGELPSDKDDDADRNDPLNRSDDTFNDLLRAAVSPLDTVEPAIQPDQFLRLPAGAKVSDRFVVEWCVGAGGMGDVYRCQDLETQTAAALKVIRRVDDHSRFRREAAILSALTHDAIVRYLAHGTTDAGTPYLAMEWLEGEDLAQILSRSSLSVADSLTIARRVCEGLLLAHRYGFVHRDIKPSNIFVCRGRFAETKVLDFGVAHRGLTTQTATRAGTMLGTVGYMAPEQAWGMPSPDPRDDLFSLGCVLFECLTGRPAFAGESSVAVLEAVLQLEAPDIRTLAPHVSEELAILVRGLLRKTRKDRPGDVDSVMRALDEIGTGRVGHGTQEPRVIVAPPAIATLVFACGSSVPDALSGLARRAGATFTSAQAQACVVAWKTAPDVALVDIAERAVQCAFELQSVRPELAIRVSAPTYDIADAELTEIAERSSDHAMSTLTEPGVVSIDPVIAALYRSRFESAQQAWPSAVRIDGDDPLPQTAFVGRDAELAVLHAMFSECESDEVVSATLITGPSGSGKSRLLAEFLTRIEADERVCILRARASHREHEVPASLLRRLQPMTAQLDSASSPEAALEQALAAGTLVVSIDDAQHADLESMRVIAESMTKHAERPFLVIGAARSAMNAALRRAWQSIGARDLPLRPMSARTAERYAHALRPETQASQDELGREIALAEGNPRLLRALVSAGRNQGARLDASLALLAERLIALPGSELSVLCAASIFAEQFGLSAVRAVVESDSGIARDLTTLCERKLLVESPASRSAPETEFSFAHPFIHEAAYRCLSATERARIRERAVQRQSRAKFEAHGPRLRD